ncbi:MAG TPA: TIGR01777 family oxidoreductase [Verrucomicrobiae bacterium]|nr:TIGR01777 family oxidoreductase [Verrucomicrobiae bacterium]
MTRRVVIVGGSGYLGQGLGQALAARGDDVLLLSRDPERARRRGARGRLDRWSPHDVAGLARLLDGVDAVVLLAGVPVGPWPWWLPGRRQAIVGSRIRPTAATVEAIGRLSSERRPRVLIAASGTDGYEGRDGVPATESTEYAGGFLADLCRAWEGEARQAGALGLRVAVVRIGFVLGRGAKGLGPVVLPFRIRLGGPLGTGRQWMSWIHVDDVVGLLQLAIDDDRVEGPINAVSPEPAREADVARAIGKALGRTSWLRVPAVVIRLVMGEAAILALGSRRIAPARALELGYRFAWTDLPGAIRDALGR